MQKIISYFIVICAGILLSASVNGQTNGRAAMLNISAIGQDGAAIRATRHFWKTIGENKSEKWYKLQIGYLAEFTEGKLFSKTVYDRKGSWIYTIKEYPEQQLPEDVWRLVKSTYYDYNISFAKEINQLSLIVYIVHIENDKQWKDILVRDGEITVSREFKK
jgi:hypothetical protein